MGEASGPGIIESDQLRVVHSPDTGMYAVFSPGASHILLFDSSGAFVRRIGRPRPGPKEIAGLIDVQFNGSRVVALDYAGPKLLVMDLMGRHISDTRLPVRAGRFRMVADTSLVVGSIDASPSLVGHPLHTIVLTTGQAIRHFGSKDGEFRAYEPFAEDVVLGWSPDQSRVWRGDRSRVYLEEWHVDGPPLRTVHGKLGWFDEPEPRRS